MTAKTYARLFLAVGLLNAFGAQAWMSSDGKGLVYGSSSNVTWVQDANLLGTMESDDPDLISKIIAAVPEIYDTGNRWDTPSNSGVHTVSSLDFSMSGQVNWYGAQAFVGYLNKINYKGYNVWLLPKTFDQLCNSVNCTNSRLGHPRGTLAALIDPKADQFVTYGE